MATRARASPASPPPHGAGGGGADSPLPAWGEGRGGVHRTSATGSASTAATASTSPTGRVSAASPISSAADQQRPPGGRSSVSGQPGDGEHRQRDEERLGHDVLLGDQQRAAQRHQQAGQQPGPGAPEADPSPATSRQVTTPEQVLRQRQRRQILADPRHHERR